MGWEPNVRPALLLTFAIILISRGVAAGDSSPRVSLLWPSNYVSVAEETQLKIKADASDPDGNLQIVRFYVDESFVGSVTTAPYNLIWTVTAPFSNGILHVRAEATDTEGATAVSQKVPLVYSSTEPTSPVVAILAPADGTIIPVGKDFDFVAEVLASGGDSGPVEFFVGTNSVGNLNQDGFLNATNPPLSVTVTNAAEGSYGLTVRYYGGNGSLCLCNYRTNYVRVARLGLNRPRLVDAGSLEIELVTAFPGQEIEVQESEDFRSWSVITTVLPATNSQMVRVPLRNERAMGWYRAVIRHRDCILAVVKIMAAAEKGGNQLMTPKDAQPMIREAFPSTAPTYDAREKRTGQRPRNR